MCYFETSLTMAVQNKDKLKVSFRRGNMGINRSKPLIIEIEFLSSIPKKCICSSCQQLLKDPCLLSCCGSAFCKECVNRLNGSTKKCSRDKCGKEYTVISEGSKIEDLRKKLLGLKVYCPMRGNGCRWTGVIEQLEKDHLKSSSEDLSACQFQEVHCPNQCGTFLPRGKMKEHRLSHCTRQLALCSHCGIEGKIEEILIHQRMCPSTPVQCDKCKIKGIPRCDILAHLEEKCPQRIIFCKYRYVGCYDEIKFVDISDHNSKCYQKHLDLLSEKLQFVSNENIELCQEVEELRMENERLAKIVSMESDTISSSYVVMRPAQEKPSKPTTISPKSSFDSLPEGISSGPLPMSSISTLGSLPSVFENLTLSPSFNLSDPFHFSNNAIGALIDFSEDHSCSVPLSSKSLVKSQSLNDEITLPVAHQVSFYLPQEDKPLLGSSVSSASSLLEDQCSPDVHATDLISGVYENNREIEAVLQEERHLDNAGSIMDSAAKNMVQSCIYEELDMFNGVVGNSPPNIPPRNPPKKKKSYENVEVKHQPTATSKQMESSVVGPDVGVYEDLDKLMKEVTGTKQNLATTDGGLSSNPLEVGAQGITSDISVPGPQLSKELSEKKVRNLFQIEDPNGCRPILNGSSSSVPDQFRSRSKSAGNFLASENGYKRPVDIASKTGTSSVPLPKISSKTLKVAIAKETGSVYSGANSPPTKKDAELSITDTPPKSHNPKKISFQLPGGDKPPVPPKNIKLYRKAGEKPPIPPKNFTMKGGVDPAFIVELNSKLQDQVAKTGTL